MVDSEAFELAQLADQQHIAPGCSGRGTGQQLKLPKGQTVQRLLPLIDG